MTTPANLPSQVGVPSGAPTDILSISLFLSQFSQSVNGWVARAANAVNYLLGQSLGQNAYAEGTNLANNMGITTTPSMVGAHCVIIPKTTGRVLVLTNGLFDVTTGITASFAQQYGTGTPPIQGAAAAGTQIPNSTTTPNGPATFLTYNISRILPGLHIGTSYWFDTVASTSSSTGTLFFNMVTVVEI